MNTKRKLIILVALVLTIAAGFYTVIEYRELNRNGRKFEQAGLDALNQHNAKIAKDEWMLGISADPTYPRNFEHLGDLGVAMQQKEQAAKYHYDALMLDPRNAELAQKACAENITIGNFTKVRSAARDAIAHGADTAILEEYLGVAAEKEKDFPAAVQALKRAHELAPGNDDYLLGYASILVDGERMGEAELLVRQYLTRHPKVPYANFMLSVILSKKPPTPLVLQDTLQHAATAAKFEPTSLEYWTILGDTYLRMNRLAESKMAYIHANAINNTSEPALQGLVTCFNGLHEKIDSEKAAVFLKQAIQLHQRIDILTLKVRKDPHDITDAIELAKLTEADHQHKVAGQMYTTILQNNPDDPRAHEAASQYFLQINRRDLAVAAKNYRPAAKSDE